MLDWRPRWIQYRLPRKLMLGNAFTHCTSFKATERRKKTEKQYTQLSLGAVFVQLIAATPTLQAVHFSLYLFLSLAPACVSVCVDGWWWMQFINTQRKTSYTLSHTHTHIRALCCNDTTDDAAIVLRSWGGGGGFGERGE